MRKRKVGIITFSDGRDFVHNDLLELNKVFRKDSLRPRRNR